MKYSQNQSVPLIPTPNEKAREDLQIFLLAIDSYPERVAKQPDLSFEAHLCSFLAMSGKDSSA